MAWEGDTAFRDLPEAVPGGDASIELVGTYLRLTGRIPLGRFGRLTDLINALSGYVQIHDAQLLRMNGGPAGLLLPEIMVDQDEIAFIAQSEAQQPEPGAAAGFVNQPFAQTQHRTARELVLFTPGHTIRGSVYLFGETDLRGFVDTTDPRFIAVTNATTRSLANSRIVNNYPLLILNRTQMIAASEIAHDDAAAEAGPAAAEEDASQVREEAPEA
jgi:hypothetical protein